MAVFQMKRYIQSTKAEPQDTPGGPGGEGMACIEKSSTLLDALVINEKVMGSEPQNSEMLVPLPARTDESTQVNPSVGSVGGSSGPVPEQTRLAPLSERLARLVHAATSGHLQVPARLPQGNVPDLGEHVQAWAATYATGGSIKYALARLEEAYSVWQRDT